MKHPTTTLFIFVIALLQISCNPECEPVFGLEVNPKFASPGTQVLVAAQPISALNRSFDVYFNDQKADATYLDNMGLLVTVPANTPERATLKVADSDCEHTLDFNVRESEWFTNNPDYVFPSPPNLILPSFPPSFPPALSNAWFSPQNLDYCIWFKMDCQPHPTTQGVCIESNSINPNGSAELSVLSACNPNNDAPLHHGNSVFGILDKENNIINFWVDRTSKNLGIEEFKGQFIDINSAGFNESKVPPCDPFGGAWVPDKNVIMLVTSQKTGKQLVMYRVDNTAAAFAQICTTGPPCD